MNSFSKIIIDNFYTQQLFKPLNIDDLMALGYDIQFLIESNKSDVDFRKRFSDLSDKINVINEENYLEFIEKLIPYSYEYLSIRDSLDGKVIGFFRFNNHNLSIEIYLHAGYRGKNIVSRIFNEFITQVKNLEESYIRFIGAEVQIDNFISTQFCLKNGFTEISRTETKITYRRSLI